MNVETQSVECITVAVPAEMAELLRSTVDGGDYASTGEIVRDALIEWARTRADRNRALNDLRQLIQEGADSGPGIPAHEVFAELHARYADDG